MHRIVFISILIFIGGSIAWYYRMHTGVTASKNYSATVIKAGDTHLYPDSIKTPGDILTTDTSTVCQPTYFRSIKDVSEEAKKAIYKRYGLHYPQAKGKYEEDRLIPIELGGSNNSKNIWPQSLEPHPGYEEKNAVDNFLHAQVCTGQMTLAQAQHTVRSDWYAVYLTISK